ncbi:MAG: ABC transporter permease [Elusimicrobiales bacterium]|jgi:peptide/nickel transport system permease protein|nr:ABC transporter permease [Elusimicrobiales bacterium]NLH39576.1 ABC transporter permease [Elusimicrobiota bacterium]
MLTFKNLYSRIIKNRQATVGVAIILLYIIIAVFAPIIAGVSDTRDPYIAKQHSFSPVPEKPSSKAIFGTTQNQYDIFYSMIWGTRLAFKISVFVVMISLVIGVILGWLSGYYGGWVDDVIMRITDIVLSIPSLILAIVIASILGPGIDKIIAAIAFVSWPSYARLFRSEILKIKSMDFITYSKLAGASSWWIFKKHLIPNSIYSVIVIAALDISNIVLMASSLSFLGLGSPQGYSDWGEVISMSRNWIISSFSNPAAYWHIVVIPSAFMFFFVLAFNMVGDSFRDIFDPNR